MINNFFVHSFFLLTIYVGQSICLIFRKDRKKLNNIVELESMRNKNLIQLNFYNELMSGNKINSYFYLQDGLHLNNSGYQIIIRK